MLSPLESRRLAAVDELVRRIDTVALLTCDEVLVLRREAQAGKFDDIMEDLLKGSWHS